MSSTGTRLEILDEAGSPVKAQCEIGRVGRLWTVTLLSRGGTIGSASERNPGYSRGLRLLLARAARLGAVLVDALVDSTTVRDLADDERRVLFPAPMQLTSATDVDKLAGELMSNAALVTAGGRRASGGNPTKRLALRLQVPGPSDGPGVLDWLVGAVTGDEDAGLTGDEAVAGLREGAVQQVIVNRYERNRAARARCIALFGSRCRVCGIDFGETYGELGEGFIHVHHVVPVSAIGEEYELDPINDLVPVCPNCHAMLHRGQVEPRSVEELKETLAGLKATPQPHQS